MRASLDLTPDSVSVLPDTREIIVVLPSFEWDFAPGEVRLCSVEKQLSFRQVGSGNHEGRAVVILRPLGPWSDVDRFLQRIGKGTLSIMR